jgi:signal transduction protein with GAF and PtsI domain
MLVWKAARPRKYAASLRSRVGRKTTLLAWDNRVVNRAKELEQRLERTEQQLRLLQKISRCMVREMSLEQALEGVVQLVVDFMECDSCLLYLLDHNELVLRATNTPHPAAVGNVKLALNEGLTGWVAREKRLLAISREAYHDPRFKFFSDLPEDTFEAFLSAPVISRQGVGGVINVQHREPHPHTGFEMELLTTVGEQVGCLLLLSGMEAKLPNESSDLVLSSGPERVRSS